MACYIYSEEVWKKIPMILATPSLNKDVTPLTGSSEFLKTLVKSKWNNLLTFPNHKLMILRWFCYQLNFYFPKQKKLWHIKEKEPRERSHYM